MDDRVDEPEEYVWYVNGGPCDEFSAHEELLIREEPPLLNGIGDGGVDSEVSSMLICAAVFIWSLSEWSIYSSSGGVGGARHVRDIDDNISRSNSESEVLGSFGDFVAGLNAKVELSFPNTNVLYNFSVRIFDLDTTV